MIEYYEVLNHACLSALVNIKNKKPVSEWTVKKLEEFLESCKKGGDYWENFILDSILI